MAKSWSKRAPKTKSQRQALYARCGAKAFLDPTNLTFPVMSRWRGCKLDCAGARAAETRAAQFKHRKISAKAKRLVARVCRRA